MGAKVDSTWVDKNDRKIDGNLDCFWKGSGAPKGTLMILDTSDLGPREGVKGRGKPSPGGLSCRKAGHRARGGL